MRSDEIPKKLPKSKNLDNLLSILDDLSLGILFIDLQGVVTIYNVAAEAIIGIEKSHVLWKDFWQNFDDELFGFSVRQFLADRQASKQACVPVKMATKEFLIEINVKSLNGALQGMLMEFRDVGEVKRLELITTRNDKMKGLGEMASMVAHEIRNPLGGIKGFASLLQRDLQDKPQLQRLATYIVEGTDSLNRLVNDILDYSHDMQVNLAPADLVQLTQSLILHLNADESIDPRIELRTHSSMPELIVPVDAATLKSAILNLASNAIQAMPEGGELHIDVTASENEAIITVFDTGFGIAPQNLEKIFSPFFTTRAKGHGLGLTEAQKIVQAHDGQLDVRSEIGVGTTFTIRLPRSKKTVKKQK